MASLTRGLAAGVAFAALSALAACKDLETRDRPAGPDTARFDGAWQALRQREEPFYIEVGAGENLMGRVRRVSDLRDAADAGTTMAADPSNASLPDVLAAEDISAVVRRQLGNVKYCYQRLGKPGSTPQPSGRAIVHFVIESSGAVSGVQVDAPAFAGTDLSDCVGRQIERWVFPPSKQGGMAVSYPFVFVGG